MPSKQTSIRIPDDIREIINYVSGQLHCSFTQALTTIVADYANKVLLPKVQANGLSND